MLTALRTVLKDLSLALRVARADPQSIDSAFRMQDLKIVVGIGTRNPGESASLFCDFLLMHPALLPPPYPAIETRKTVSD